MIAAHPDDGELGAGGLLAMQAAKGKKTGVLDLTRGELGTRGTPELRSEEAQKASEILGVSWRKNLALSDGFFRNDPETQRQVIREIRRTRPEIVIGNAPSDRHPDHGRGNQLIRESSFYSGLAKIETKDENGILQEAWRPGKTFYFIQNNYIEPTFIVDISAYWDVKLQAIKAYSSQFYNPARKEGEPETFISSDRFLKFLEARARDMGHKIGAEYGEGFISDEIPGLHDIFDLKI